MKKALTTLIFSFTALFMVPANATAAHLYFSAPPATVCEGSSFTLQLLMDSPSEAINAGQVDLSFDPAVATVNSMNWLSSIFRFFAEGPSWDNGAGTIHMIGGLPTPGFQGTGGLIAELTMTANGLGNPNLEYNAATTDILLDDGFGTSTTVTFNNAVISILPSTDPSCVVVTPTPGPTPPPSTPGPTAPPRTPGPTPTPCPTCQLFSDTGEVLDLRLCQMQVECANAEPREFDVFLGADDPTQCPIVTRCQEDTELTEDITKNIIRAPFGIFVAVSQGIYAGPFFLGMGLGLLLALAAYALYKAVRRWYLRVFGRKEHPPHYPDIPRQR